MERANFRPTLRRRIIHADQTHIQYTHNMFTVITDPEKGKVLAASQDLQPGVAVFEELPLMRITQADVDKCKGRILTRMERIVASFDQFNKVLSARQQMAFLTLQSASSEQYAKSVLSIAKASTWEDCKTVVNEEQAALCATVSSIELSRCFATDSGSYTFEKASWLSLSCQPNCCLDTRAAATEGAVCRTITCVKAGEVLTVEPQAWYQTESIVSRRKLMVTTKNFVCHCSRCEAIGDDTRQFCCFDTSCPGRHYTHQALIDDPARAAFAALKYEDAYLLPCTVCVRSPPPEYESRMLQLEGTLSAFTKKISLKLSKLPPIPDGFASSRALVREIEAFGYPPWHAGALAIANTEQTARMFLYSLGAPEQRDKLLTLADQVVRTIESVLAFPALYKAQIYDDVGSVYKAVGREPERAREFTLKALRMKLLIYGRTSPPQTVYRAALELDKTTPITFQEVCFPTQPVPALPPSAPRGADLGCCALCEETPAGAAIKLSLCGRCRGVAYCSAGCQKAHWKVHKVTCGKV